MLMREISFIQASPMPQPTASVRISPARRSRSSAFSTLESSSPMRSKPSAKMTAPATTGPARQPLPASSVPAVSFSCMSGALKSSPCSMTTFFRILAMCHLKGRKMTDHDGDASVPVLRAGKRLCRKTVSQLASSGKTVPSHFSRGPTPHRSGKAEKRAALIDKIPCRKSRKGICLLERLTRSPGRNLNSGCGA